MVNRWNHFRAKALPKVSHLKITSNHLSLQKYIVTRLCGLYGISSVHNLPGPNSSHSDLQLPSSELCSSFPKVSRCQPGLSFYGSLCSNITSPRGFPKHPNTEPLMYTQASPLPAVVFFPAPCVTNPDAPLSQELALICHSTQQAEGIEELSNHTWILPYPVWRLEVNAIVHLKSIAECHTHVTVGNLGSTFKRCNSNLLRD